MLNLTLYIIFTAQMSIWLHVLPPDKKIALILMELWAFGMNCHLMKAKAMVDYIRLSVKLLKSAYFEECLYFLWEAICIWQINFKEQHFGTTNDICQAFSKCHKVRHMPWLSSIEILANYHSYKQVVNNTEKWLKHRLQSSYLVCSSNTIRLGICRIWFRGAKKH